MLQLMESGVSEGSWPRWLDPDSPWGWVPAALVVAVIAAWGGARAVLVGLTHDEALTLLIHVPGSWADIFAHRRYIGSNNHLLNTALIKILLHGLPPHEWVVRLPALAGLAMYLVGCWRVLRRWFSGPRVVVGVVLLAANPFVLDFMTLGRGYGLGLGLLVLGASLALDAAGATSPAVRWRRSGAAAALALLAILANLSLVYGVVAVGALALAGAVRCGWRDRSVAGLWPRIGPVAVPWTLGAVSAALFYRPPVLSHIGTYVAEWGGARGFWADTVSSLAAASLYRPQWQQLAPALTLLFAIVLAGGSVLAAWQLRRRREWSPLATSTGLVWLIAGSMGVVHLAVGIRWPIDRSALVLIPAFCLVLLGAWEVASSQDGRWLRIGGWAAGLVAVVLAVVWVSGCNLHRSYLWAMDAPTPAVVRAVGSATALRMPESVRMRVSWQLEPVVNFYRVSLGVRALEPVRRTRVHEGFDFYYLHETERSVAESLGLATCREFPRAGTFLAVPVGVPCPPL